MAFQVVGVERFEQPLVRGRVELLIVDAVEDAGEVALAGAQHGVEPGAVLGREDLARVGRADGVDRITPEDALPMPQRVTQRSDVSGDSSTRSSRQAEAA